MTRQEYWTLVYTRRFGELYHDKGLCLVDASRRAADYAEERTRLEDMCPLPAWEATTETA